MTKQEIEKILKLYSIYNYTINNDLSVDVDENVSLGFNNFKLSPIIFRKITRNFFCWNCSNLISLKGFPKEVGEYFACWNCSNLFSLQYAPLKCKIVDFKDHFLKGNNISKIEADKYLLRRILLGEYEFIDKLSNKNKIQPLLVMKDFNLL